MRWWAADEKDMHGPLVNAYKHLKDEDSREETYKTYEALYTNRNLSGTDFAGFSDLRNGAGGRYSRMPLNVSKLMVDSVIARVAKIRPRPLFVTEGGNFSLYRRARLQERWVLAQWEAQRVYQRMPQIFSDACRLGIGFIKPHAVGTEVHFDRVYPGDLLVDGQEAFSENVRQLYESKWISKEQLKADYPGKEELIDRSGEISDRDRDIRGFNPLSDQVLVVEAWRLPSRKGAGDGMHAISTSEGILHQNKYTYSDFPHVAVRWVPEPRGFYGIGLCEELMGIHLDINVTRMKINKAFELTASPQVWVEETSNVTKLDITDIQGSVNTYRKTPPKFMTPPPVPPEYFAYLDRQLAQARQIARLSDSAFGTRVPSGLETGAAVRNFHDIETESFSMPSREYEDGFLQLARKTVRVGREIAAANPKYSIVLEGDHNTIETVDWKDASIDETKEAYVIKVLPTSSLSSSPSGRMADVQDLLNMGVIDATKAGELLDFPDLQAHNDLSRAAEDRIDQVIEKILDTGEYEGPEPYMKLELAVAKATAAVNRAVTMGVPEPHIRELRRFARMAFDEIKKAAQELAATQAALPVDQSAGLPPNPGEGVAPPPGSTTQG